MVKPDIKELKNVNRANVGKPFTDDDDAMIRTMRSRHTSVPFIARFMGRTEAAINARMERIGLR